MPSRSSLYMYKCNDLWDQAVKPVFWQTIYQSTVRPRALFIASPRLAYLNIVSEEGKSSIGENVGSFSSGLAMRRTNAILQQLSFRLFPSFCSSVLVFARVYSGRKNETSGDKLHQSSWIRWYQQENRTQQNRTIRAVTNSLVKPSSAKYSRLELGNSVTWWFNVSCGYVCDL